MRFALRLILLAVASAGGVTAGRIHERTRPYGTRYFRSQYEVMLHIYEPERLPWSVPPARPFRTPLRLEGAVAAVSGFGWPPRLTAARSIRSPK